VDIRSTIVTALASCGCPVYWVKWRGGSIPPAAYIVFQTACKESSHADDEVAEREYFVYLNIYSETDPYTIAVTVSALMKTAGFEEMGWDDVGQETMSVTELRDYHLTNTFQYTEVI